MEEFSKPQYAEAGTDYSGVLCGRATCKDAIPVYAKQGLKALEDWLTISKYLWQQNENVVFEQSRNVVLTAPSFGDAGRTTTHDPSR
jgi:tagatose-1,6-bisphosphate aldolase